MAVTETVTKEQVTMKLNNGTSASGTLKFVNLSLGNLSAVPSAYDGQKVANLVEAIEPCLTKTVSSTLHIQTAGMSWS